MLNSVTERINQIANSLLSQSNFLQSKKSASGDVKVKEHENFVRHELGPVLEAIVNEKVIQYSNHKRIVIEKDLAEGFGLYSNFDKFEFCRIISNLINNSVEAIVESGFVKISIRKHQMSNMIVIHDSGKGMPKDFISQIGRKSFSFGKENGSGLGLYHATNTIEKFGGTLIFETREFVGTMVSIKLPAADAP